MNAKTRRILIIALVLLCAFLYFRGQAGGAGTAAGESDLSLLPAAETTSGAEAALPTETDAPSSPVSETTAPAQDAGAQDSPMPAAAPIDEDGVYDSKEDVALYLHTYGHLPSNYITKAEAEKLGWSGGSLERYAPGKCIGGGRFGNYEGLLPDAPGRRWSECDIDTLGASSRGARRLVYSNDGLIYYTDDHYESFEQLYGGET